MNRLEMAEQIERRLPTLAKQYKDELQKAEQMRTSFIADYPIKKIPALALDEYVIGRGSSNRSLCYRLEREMDSLGRILGATAFKFGIYFGKTKSDAVEEYRFASHWGSTAEESFTAVKQAIVNLLESAGEDNLDAIADNHLSPMFKSKLLFLYFPEKYAPIYSEEHLKHFITELDLGGTFRGGADMQRALMRYRATWPELMAQPALLYMRLLYALFGYPSENKLPDQDSNNVPLLDEAVRGANFIAEMPAILADEKPKTESQGKSDYEKREKRLRRIGDRGEAVVVALERKRLIQVGKSNLAENIKHVSQEDDNAGYDILSFDEDGTHRPIEVKATSGSNLDRGFYISSNELEKAGALTNYHLYLVFSTMTKKPRVLPLKQPVLNGGDFLLRPIAYHATISTNK